MPREIFEDGGPVKRASAALNPSVDPVSGTQSLDRALSVLLQVAESPPPGLTLAQCAAILSYSKPTTQRMLVTLTRRDFLFFNEDLGVYSLGVANARLGAEYLDRLDLRRIALPALRTIVEETGETAHLGTVSGTDVVYIELVDSPHPVRLFSRVGDSIPAYATAVGKAILAWMPESELSEHLPETLVGRTPHTLTTFEALRADLAETRERGYSVDEVENRPGIRGFAAPVFDHTGRVIAGVSIAGPENRITGDRRSTLGKLIRETADSISAALGAPIKTRGISLRQ